MHKGNLSWYVVGVATVWAVILCAAWLFDGGARLKTLALVAGGFAIGMLAMYTILFAAWRFDEGAHFKTLATVCGGFVIGMLAMYLAMHVHKWK